MAVGSRLARIRQSENAEGARLLRSVRVGSERTSELTSVLERAVPEPEHVVTARDLGVGAVDRALFVEQRRDGRALLACRAHRCLRALGGEGCV